MKVVHSNVKTAHTTAEWLQKAREQEVEGELEEAATAYEKVIKSDNLNELAYNRLMIIYRKTKQPEKELAVIKRGIKAFEEFYTSARKNNKKVSSLSLSLMKLTGLADKKGKSLYDPEPIARWKKRKAMVESKLRK